MEAEVSGSQGGDRRQAMSYFRYASLVTDELAAETPSAADRARPELSGDPAGARSRASTSDRSTGGMLANEEAASQLADAAGLTTALWRAAHALSPASTPADRSAAAPGPYSATAAREAAPPAGGAGHLDRRG